MIYNFITIYLLLLLLYKIYLNFCIICIQLSNFIKYIFILNSLVNIYELHIQIIYDKIRKNTYNCIKLKLNNKKIITGKLLYVQKISNNILLFIRKNDDIYIELYRNISKLKKKPYLNTKKKLYSILEQKIPIELIIHIGNYICDCRSCKNIINSQQMLIG